MIPKQQYIVSVYEQSDVGGILSFTFVPMSAPNEHAPNGRHRPPEYIVTARKETNHFVIEWAETSDDPKSARVEIEAEVRARLDDRTIWISRVAELVNQVEQWAHEMNWTTRRVETKLDDIRVGPHRVSGLLMQEDTCKVLLEPVGRSAPGAEGMVDLYLMPAYDDIANLYYYDDRWNVHYAFPRSKAVATVREGTALPLSRETLERTLAEMRQHAA